MQLALGTVQFGLDYGIANRAGQVQLADMHQILMQAWQHNIQVLDTAHAYGNSESRIGDYCQQHTDQNFQIITKLSTAPTQNLTADNIHQLQQQFSLSLERLRQKQVYGLLLHSCHDLRKAGHQQLWQQLLMLKNQNQIKKLGVSVYHLDEIDFLLENFDIDIIQLPLNIFDQRVICEGHLEKLHHRGIEIHVRSVFLQGLLLMPMTQAQLTRPQANPALLKFHNYCHHHQLSPLAVCLWFIHQQSMVNQVVIGAQSLQQLQEITQAWQMIKTADSVDFSWCSQTDLSIIDPSRWT